MYISGMAFGVVFVGVFLLLHLLGEKAQAWALIGMAVILGLYCLM